jgi:hypothetical protein
VPDQQKEIVRDAARKAAKAAADKGQPLSDELSRLELLQGKDFRDAYEIEPT